MELIYEHLKKGVRKQKNKTAIFLCGASGSGKSSNRQTMLNEVNFKQTHIVINLDDIIAYQQKFNGSRKIVSELVVKSADDGYSIVYDGTCRYPKYVTDKINFLKEKGYKIVLILNYASLPTVIKRVKQRLHQPTPEDTVQSIYKEFSEEAEKYMSIKNIDELYLFSNESERTKMVFSRKNKSIKCISPNEEFYFDVSKYC